jgi:release factor glutamine methyltransferase
LVRRSRTAIRQLLKTGRGLLAAEEAAGLEAEILLRHALQVDRAYLYAHPESVVQPAQQDRYLAMIERRQRGEPIAYITGEREFWSLPLEVNREVLIPRPETERLVECALERIPVDAKWRIADLGTGSGAVALAIASERPLCDIQASDLSPEALQLARKNANRLSLEVSFHLGSWLQPLNGRFKLIVSNPPYVAENDRHLQIGDCRFEPGLALASGPDGLDAIRRIALDATDYLFSGGTLLLEHGREQASAVRGLLTEAGYSDVFTVRDLEGNDRISGGVV